MIYVIPINSKYKTTPDWLPSLKLINHSVKITIISNRDAGTMNDWKLKYPF